MAPTEIGIVLLAGLIIFSGHFVKGVSGFGSALFSVPLLMLFLDIQFITPVFLLFDFTSGVILVASNYRSIHRRLLLLLLGGMLVGTAIGTWVLLSFDHDLLKRILGLLVIGWALLMLFRKERPANPTSITHSRTMPYLAPLSGFLGGALGAAFSVNGPPIIVYLSHVLREKQVFRATLYGIFFADACYKMVLFSANGLLTGEVLRFALLMIPFLVTGAFVGSWLQTRLDEALFKKIIAVILLVTGVMLVI